MKALFAPLILIFFVTGINGLSGCASLGVPIPDTDRQNLATAEIIFTALVEQADAMAVSGDLSGDTLVTVQRVVAGGSAALDGAQAAVAANDVDDFEKWFGVIMASIAEIKRTLPAIATI